LSWCESNPWLLRHLSHMPPIQSNHIPYHIIPWHDMPSHHITAYPHWYSSKIPCSFDVTLCSMKHLPDGMHIVHACCIFWRYSNIQIYKYANMIGW
jgi:hypothetical protein